MATIKASIFCLFYLCIEGWLLPGICSTHQHAFQLPVYLAASRLDELCVVCLKDSFGPEGPRIAMSKCVFRFLAWLSFVRMWLWCFNRGQVLKQKMVLVQCAFEFTAWKQRFVYSPQAEGLPQQGSHCIPCLFEDLNFCMLFSCVNPAVFAWRCVWLCFFCGGKMWFWIRYVVSSAPLLHCCNTHSFKNTPRSISPLAEVKEVATACA